MLGNPVKIGDGCATVTGYKLPEPLVSRSRDREGGSEVGGPKSGYRFGCARPVPRVRDQLLRPREGWGQFL